jgi:uncharacterized protein (DUF305 family)
MDISPERPQRRPLVIAVSAALLVAVAAAVLIVGWTGTPADSSAEAGFARDMAVHHSQAVEMSFMARDASDDERLHTLTYDIIVTQTAQRGIFMGWLQQWGLNQASERPAMAWMAGHGGHAAGPTLAPGSTMPGMASDAELARLERAEGKDAEILFLQLMIRHHEGGVQMADALLDLSERDEVVTMARHISEGQKGEIALMTEMLKERGAEPYPSILK